MSRSPWRDALDGQIKILRELRSTAATIHFARSANIPSAQKFFTKEKDLLGFQMQAGATMAEGIEHLVREAEPIHLSHDIFEAILRQLRRDALNDTLQTDIRLTPDMLPIPNGLLYFSGSHLVVDEIKETAGNEREVSGIAIKALYFGEPIEVQVTPKTFGGVDIELRSDPSRRIGMGIIAFLDSVKSGYMNMTREFGPHLVPVALGYWRYGQTIEDYVTDKRKTFEGNEGEDPFHLEKRGTQILMSCTGAFLQKLFLLMLQRVTRWGGVGLNRTEQRDAEREHLRPRIQLVTWRKANYRYPTGYIPVPKNWTCRWSVRPHYRRYKSGKVVEIKSYIKGPPDKPYRSPDQRAHHVKH